MSKELAKLVLKANEGMKQWPPRSGWKEVMELARAEVAAPDALWTIDVEHITYSWDDNLEDRPDLHWERLDEETRTMLADRVSAAIGGSSIGEILNDVIYDVGQSFREVRSE